MAVIEAPSAELFDADEYINDLFTDAGLSEEVARAAQEALRNPKVVGRLHNSVASRQKAQSALDRAREATNRANGIYDNNVKWRDEKEQEYNERLRQAQTSHFPRTNEEESRPVTQPFDTNQFVTKEDLSKVAERILSEVSKVDQDSLTAMTMMFDLSNHYRESYGKSLNQAELIKYAGEHKLPVHLAYDRFCKPLEDEKRAAETQKKIDEAREQGRLEALSQRDEPSAGSGDHAGEGALRAVMFGRAKTQTITSSDGKPLEGEDAFVRSWQQTNGFTRSDKTH